MKRPGDAASRAVLAAIGFHGRSLCMHCGGGVGLDCPRCGLPTIPRANGGKWCHRCGARLKSLYTEAAETVTNPTSKKKTGSSGRRPGITPAARAAYLESKMPASERIRLYEGRVGNLELDAADALQGLRGALVDVEAMIRTGARSAGLPAPASRGATLEQAVAGHRSDAQLRASMPAELHDSYQRLFAASDRLSEAEASLRLARRMQDRNLAAKVEEDREQHAAEDAARRAAYDPGERWRDWRTRLSETVQDQLAAERADHEERRLRLWRKRSPRTGGASPGRLSPTSRSSRRTSRTPRMPGQPRNST